MGEIAAEMAVRRQPQVPPVGTRQRLLHPSSDTAALQPVRSAAANLEEPTANTNISNPRRGRTRTASQDSFFIPDGVRRTNMNAFQPRGAGRLGLGISWTRPAPCAPPTTALLAPVQ